MRINSMDKIPLGKKDSKLFFMILAVAFAFCFFIFTNVLAVFFKWLFAFVVKNYVAIIVVVLVIAVLRKIVFRKKSILEIKR